MSYFLIEELFASLTVYNSTQKIEKPEADPVLNNRRGRSVFTAKYFQYNTIRINLVGFYATQFTYVSCKCNRIEWRRAFPTPGPFSFPVSPCGWRNKWTERRRWAPADWKMVQRLIVMCDSHFCRVTGSHMWCGKTFREREHLLAFSFQGDWWWNGKKGDKTLRGPDSWWLAVALEVGLFSSCRTNHATERGALKHRNQSENDV